MKATSTRNYVLEASSCSSSAALVSLSTNAGDLRFKASATEGTGPSLEAISLSVEKPGAFIVDVNVPKKDAQFQFMKSGLVMNKPVNIMCMHSCRDNHTSLDGTVAFNPAHKVSVSHVVASRDCRVKYTYAHGESQNTTLESCYDTGKEHLGLCSCKNLSAAMCSRGLTTPPASYWDSNGLVIPITPRH